MREYVGSRMGYVARSGNIMCRVMKKLFMVRNWATLSTVEEEALVAEIKEAVEKLKRW